MITIDNYTVQADGRTYITAEISVAKTGKAAGQTVYNNYRYFPLFEDALSDIYRRKQMKIVERSKDQSLQQALKDIEAMYKDFCGMVKEVVKEEKQ